MKKISLLCLALLILLAKGSIFTAPSNTKSLSHFGSDPRNTLSLPPSDDRKLLTCTDGLVPSACVGCCGYKFTAREPILDTAVADYGTNKTAAITNYGENEVLGRQRYHCHVIFIPK
jgi:hypothetical protein